MKKVISFILMLSLMQLVPFVLDSCEEKIEDVVKEVDAEGITYLLCGFDDAAENTDSMILANYNFSTNALTFLQIPRDTYYSRAGYTKINSIYSSERNQGKTAHEAMSILTEELSDSLGIVIDAYMGYSTSAVAKLIDCIGGVTIDLPREFTVKDSRGKTVLSLKKGENLISGKDALAFIRSRNTYAMGDIGRIDAQKFLLSAMVKEVKYNLGIFDIISMCVQSGDGWVINAKIADAFKIVLKNKGRVSNIKTKYANIPGAVAQDSSGVWYYSLSRDAAVSALEALGFRRVDAFDAKKKFLNSSDHSFTKIYHSSEYDVKVYDDDSLPGMNIEPK